MCREDLILNIKEKQWSHFSDFWRYDNVVLNQRYVLKLLSCSALFGKRSLLIQLTTPSGVSCSASFDKRCLLIQLTTPSGVSCSTSYNKRSLLTQLTTPSGVSCSTSYNKHSLLTRLTSFSSVSRITSLATGSISAVTRVVSPACLATTPFTGTSVCPRRALWVAIWGNSKHKATSFLTLNYRKVRHSKRFLSEL